MALRNRMKSLLGTALWPFPAALASRWLMGGEQGLVLTFHYIGSPVLAGVGEDLFLPLEEFRRALDFIRRRLAPLAPLEFLERLAAGTLPPRATLITFDDCLHETSTQAAAELRQRGLAACFFACPGLMADGRTVPSLELMWMCAQARPGVCRVRMGADGAAAWVAIGGDASRRAAYARLWRELLRMPSQGHAALLGRMREDFGLSGGPPARLRPANWPALEALDRGGMLVGNHTMLHSTITADGAARFEADAALAYQMLERRLGPRPRVFCYPYGRQADQAQPAEDALRRLGTQFAFVTQGGLASARRNGRLGLRREDASYSAKATRLAPLWAFFR